MATPNELQTRNFDSLLVIPSAARNNMFSLEERFEILKTYFQSQCCVAETVRILKRNMGRDRAPTEGAIRKLSALAMADPQVHYIDYPLPPKVRCMRCVKCFTAEGASKAKGEYCDPPHLAKHLKKYHPGDTLSYKCSICDLRGTSKYPLKDVKAHYAECHVSPAVNEAGPSAAASVPLIVTAGPSLRSTTTSTGGRPSGKGAAPNPTATTARRSGEAAATKRPPTTATVSKPHVLSVETVRLLVGDIHLSPTIRSSSSESLGETRTPISPVTSLLATLTTCTVTTTTCGSPITSTGFTGGVGRLQTPPSLPQTSILPTIREEGTSPCVAVATPPSRGGRSTSPLVPPRPSSPEPERGPEERRLEGAAQPPTTPVVEGDKQWGGQWTVSVRRRARRRQLLDTSPSNSESPPTAGPSRSPRIAPLSALIVASTNRHETSLNLNIKNDNNCMDRTPPRTVLPIGAERRCETSPRHRVEGDNVMVLER
ncbi:hypothetical protein G5I_12652 [Acromyrmex echinatior]|uniref:DUF4817 domain-containing protein n=1 Tax=Acromyrmex echinatior TaxID=103372 RepID=F4X2X0_ACREC|nr:hypothetical protein G5I_12652 [Acromyrmex echinatior]